MALNALAKHLDIHDDPDAIAVKIAKNAIPQYQVGHADHLARLQTELLRLSPFLTYLGSAFNGVSVNDCIHHAGEICEKITLANSN